MEDKSHVILFESNNYAVWCNDELSQNGISAKMVTVPRHLSSDCGYCVKIDSKDVELVKNIMIDQEIEYEDILPLNRQ